MSRSKIVPRGAYDADYNSDDYGISFPEPSLTKQSESEACDVNVIVTRWLKSGGAMDLSQRVGQFLDVADVPDFHTCQNFVVSAQNMFLALPVEVRERFQNDPGKFLDFASNPANNAELIKLGLATASKPAGASASPLAGEEAPAKAGSSKASPEASIVPPAGG